MGSGELEKARKDWEKDRKDWEKDRKDWKKEEWKIKGAKEVRSVRLGSGVREKVEDGEVGKDEKGEGK